MRLRSSVSSASGMFTSNGWMAVVSLPFGCATALMAVLLCEKENWNDLACRNDGCRSSAKAIGRRRFVKTNSFQSTVGCACARKDSRREWRYSRLLSSCLLHFSIGPPLPDVALQRVFVQPLWLSVEERLHSRDAERRHQLGMVMREHGRVTPVARSPRDGSDLDG